MTFPVRSLIITTQQDSLQGLSHDDVVLAGPGSPLKIGAATILVLPELAGDDWHAAFEAVRRHATFEDAERRGIVIFCEKDMARELAMRIDPTCWEQATSLGRHGGFMTFVDGQHATFVSAFSPAVAKKCHAIAASV